MRCWRCMRAGCDRGWCCAALTAASREGGGRRFAARVVVLRRVRLGGASARVSQQPSEMPRGWALFAATIAVERSPPPGRAWKGVANALEVRRTPRREPPTRAERRALRSPPPSFPRCSSKRREHCTRGADDASAIQRRHPLALLAQRAQRRAGRGARRGRRSRGRPRGARCPRPSRRRGRSVTDCGMRTWNTRSRKRSGRTFARRAWASRIASQVPSSRTGAGVCGVGQRRAREVDQLVAVLGREAAQAQALERRRHHGRGDARPVGDLGRRGGAEAAEVAPHRVVDGVVVVDRPAVRASPRPGA